MHSKIYLSSVETNTSKMKQKKERLLPFEHSGVESTWVLSFPAAVKAIEKKKSEVSTEIYAGETRRCGNYNTLHNKGLRGKGYRYKIFIPPAPLGFIPPAPLWERGVVRGIKQRF